MNAVCSASRDVGAGRQEPTIIVGLGNPGSEYTHTRHNVGFRCVDRLASSHGLRFKSTRFKSSLAVGLISGISVVLAKPLTYMNLCGRAVGSLVRYHRVDLERLLIVYDDLDLPLGQVRLRSCGGSGGHKGMRSIIDSLTASEFPRLRVGIGRPVAQDPSDYVLDSFSVDERIVMDSAYDRAVQAMECYLVHGIEAAMNEFNG